MTKVSMENDSANSSKDEQPDIVFLDSSDVPEDQSVGAGNKPKADPGSASNQTVVENRQPEVTFLDSDSVAVSESATVPGTVPGTGSIGTKKQTAPLDSSLADSLTAGSLPAGSNQSQQLPPSSVSSKSSKQASVRSWPFRLVDGLAAIYLWCFGFFGIVLCLAIAAVIPLFQFMALGYFLEVSRRIRLHGSIKAGFVGFDKAAKLAGIVIGTWLLLWPVTLLGIWWEASYLIDPDSQTTQSLARLQVIGTTLIIAHILAAWFCGGKLRYFFWPLVAPFAFAVWAARRLANSKIFRPLLDFTIGKISPKFVDDLCRAQPVSDWFLPAIIWKSFRAGELFTRARDGVWDFILDLKLHHLFWLGLRGFLGTIIWLAIPVTIMIISARSVDAVAILTGLAGILSFAMVATYLPILQVHFASENRFSAMFELKVARETFRRAPIRHLMTTLATFVFALPLFLLKIERIFPELLFLPAIVFIVFMLPARFISGWTFLNACQKEKQASLWFRWPAWTLQLGLAVAFAGFVFLMRFVIWTGAAGLFDQHAFLVPAPFVEWPF